MRRYLAVNKNVCTGCRHCEYVCSYAHNDAYNPSRSRIRVNRKDCLDFITLVCLHCPKPVCKSACNYSAIEIVDGVVRVHEALCVGCGDCIEACPRMFRDGLTGKAINCDLCGACVEACPEGALTIKTIGEK